MSAGSQAGDHPKNRVRRTRRRNNGRAERAGVTEPPTRDAFSRTLALVRAALKAWETRHPHLEAAPVWRTKK